MCGILCTTLNAQMETPALQNTNVVANQQPSIHKLDREALLLLRDELESAKKTLIDIRDSQNPSVAKQALSKLGGVIKELTYILSAIAIDASVVSAICTILDIRHEDILNGKAGIVLLPVATFSILFTYIFLKFVFGWLLASSNKNITAQNIKDSLVTIDQIINKLNYEIAKIQRIDQELYNNQQALPETTIKASTTH